MKDKLERREFLQRATVATTVAAVGSGVAHGAVPNDKTIPLTDAIAAREFGKTGVKLPILGYGGAALPKVWGNPLSTEDRVKLVRYAYDRGIRYFDTAGNYMESQPIMGEGLKDVRDKVFLATKVETTNPAKVREAVEKCLKQLQTDYLDTIQIHGTPGLEFMSVERAMEIHGELLKLRDEKMVRFIGFSAHSYFEKALALIKSDGFDQCLLSYGYLPRGYNQVLSSRMVALRNACVAEAHQRNMGIVAMKVVAAGMLGAWSGRIVPAFDKQRLGGLPAAAMRYVLQDKRVHILNIGMRLPKEIDANIAVLSNATAYTLEDRALLAEFCAHAYDSEPVKRLRVD